jgi:hypothetical protein
MPRFSITKDDLLRAKTIKPGVYTLLVKNVSDGPGKADPQSNVTTIDFVVDAGPDPSCIGVPIKYWLSEKWPAGGVGFIEAVTGKKMSAEGIDIPELSIAVGRKVKAYVKNEMYQGRPTNKIDGFLAAESKGA